jgi:hypothetical protein
LKPNKNMMNKNKHISLVNTNSYIFTQGYGTQQNIASGAQYISILLEK